MLRSAGLRLEAPCATTKSAVRAVQYASRDPGYNIYRLNCTVQFKNCTVQSARDAGYRWAIRSSAASKSNVTESPPVSVIVFSWRTHWPSRFTATSMR